MKSLLIAAVLATPLVVSAKLPAPTPEQQAKAAEAKAKADEIAKQEAQVMLRYQDRAVANYAANARAQGKPFNPTPVDGNAAATLPAGGTISTADKVIPKPAEAASGPDARAGAQPSQTAGVPQDKLGGAGAPPQPAQPQKTPSQAQPQSSAQPQQR